MNSQSNSARSPRTRTAEQNERRREIRYRRKEWLYEYLLKRPCMDCGEDDPVVLEFDHQRDKDLNISRAINDWGQEKLEAELAKCEVVCSNCHKRRTAKTQKWMMATLHYSD